MPENLARRLLRYASGGGEVAGGTTDRILVVGLGNPGAQYEGTRHNLGFQVADLLADRWQLAKPRKKFAGLIAEGRAGAGGPRIALLWPQTFMNEAGSSVGPARGSLKVPLDHLVVVHDEIDLPFGEIRAKLGGGVAGHNGVRSLRDGLGDTDFWRVRAGVGRPDSTDPEVVSSYVLSRYREPAEEVRDLVERAGGEVERLVERIAAGEQAKEPSP